MINLLWKLSMCEWIYFVIHSELFINLVNFATIFVIVVYFLDVFVKVCSECGQLSSIQVMQFNSPDL